ncbi:MAG: hypothetical protein ABFC89_06535 [Methanospirillum sp.]
MLPIVINSGGTARVVTIAEALYHLGYDIKRKGGWPERTEEELRLQKAMRRRASRQGGTGGEPGAGR